MEIFMLNHSILNLRGIKVIKYDLRDAILYSILVRIEQKGFTFTLSFCPRFFVALKEFCSV